MEGTINLVTLSVLGSAMLLGGILPSVSSLAVLSRSAASGFVHGVFTSIGIVLGDIIFIVFAIYGLSVMAENLGAIYELLMFVGAAYIIWLGTILWQDESEIVEVKKLKEASLLSSLLTGLLITLSDQKAILFYLGFFPALFDMEKVSYRDTGVIIIITILMLGSAKLCYAFMGSQTNILVKNDEVVKWINKIAGALLISVGSYIMLTT